MAKKPTQEEASPDPLEDEIEAAIGEIEAAQEPEPEATAEGEEVEADGSAEDAPVEDEPAAEEPEPTPEPVRRPAAKPPAKVVTPAPAKAVPKPAPKPIPQRTAVTTIVPAKPAAPARPAAKAAPAAPVKKPAPPPAKAKPVTAAPVEEATPESPAYESVGWDDTPAQQGGFLPRYKAVKGNRDIGRIPPVPDGKGGRLKIPVKVRVHTRQVGAQFLYANCSQTEDCPACNDSDWGVDTGRDRYAVPFYHKYRKKGETTEDVAKLHVWIFGGDKYTAIKEGVVPELQEYDPPKSIHQVDLTIGCTDSKMQKLTIGVAKKNYLTTEDVASIKEDVPKFLDWLRVDFSPEDIRRRMSMKPKRKLREGNVDFGDDSADFASPDDSEKPRRGKRVEPEVEDADAALDAALDGIPE